MRCTKSCSILLLLLCALQCACAQTDREVLYQTSTIDALMYGLYDGEVSVEELLAHGDTGLGTFNALDGEMLVLGGECFKITSDGMAHRVPAQEKTPFAAVTFFDTDLELPVPAGTGLQALTELIDAALPSPNLIYAVRVDGEFQRVRTRSVPRQTRPYPKLTEVVATQPTFELQNLSGTLVGFRCPYYVKGVNVPGYHLHFIDGSRTRGGHVLDVVVRQATVRVDTTAAMALYLPTSPEFEQAELDRTSDEALHRVEKDTQ